MIAYASVYGNTENAANILAGMLADKGVRNVKVYDVSATHPSYIVSECFRASHLVFLSTTYNAGMFVNMENLVHDIVHHNLQNRTIAMVENGSWAPTAAGLMRAEFQKLKNCTILDEGVSIRSSLKEDQLAQMEALADALVASMPAQKPVPAQEKPAGLVEQNAMFSLSYGLFVLTARDGAKDNGCIISTTASSPAGTRTNSRAFRAWRVRPTAYIISRTAPPPFSARRSRRPWNLKRIRSSSPTLRRPSCSRTSPP